MKKTYLLKKIRIGERIFRIKEKISVIFIKNKIVKNLQLEYREYIRIKNKYSSTIKKEENENDMLPSNKVWVLWLQGEENAPKLIKRCIESIKKAFSNKEVIILTQNNYKDYIKFPEYIETKFEEGVISYAHFSDLLRIELLAKYGGIWCDATLYITDKIPEYINNLSLFVFKNIGLDKEDEQPVVASSWFISSCPNNNIILATRDLLFEYWKNEKFLTNYFLFHLFFKLATDIYKEEWEKVPTFNNTNPHILQFELLKEYSEERMEQIKKISFIHKLTRGIENKDKDKITFLDYILNN